MTTSVMVACHFVNSQSMDVAYFTGVDCEIKAEAAITALIHAANIVRVTTVTNTERGDVFFGEIVK